MLTAGGEEDTTGQYGWPTAPHTTTTTTSDGGDYQPPRMLVAVTAEADAAAAAAAPQGPPLLAAVQATTKGGGGRHGGAGAGAAIGGGDVDMDMDMDMDYTQSFMQNSVAQLKEDYPTLLGGLLLSVTVAVVWIYTMRLLTSIAIWATIIVSITGTLAGGLYCIGVGFRHSYTGLIVIGFLLLILVVLLCVLAISLRSRLHLTCLLIQEAATAINGNLQILFLATLLVILFVLYIIMWTASLIYLFSIPESEIIIPIGSGSQEYVLFKTSIQKLIFFNVFALFWTCSFLSAVFQMTTAAVVSRWYFSRKDIGSNALTALLRAFTLSLGSLAFGSLIVATFQFINFVVSHMTSCACQNKVSKCVNCVCVSCILRPVKFVNKYAYIYIGMHGNGFCFSTYKTFCYITQNLLRTVILNFVSEYVVYFGVLLCTVLSCFIVAVTCQAVYGGISGVTLIVVIALSGTIFTISSHIVNVAADTVFICFLEEKHTNDKLSESKGVSPEFEQMVMHNLQEAYGDNPPSNQ
ncbi:solute carrier family 44 protein member 2 [Pelomyxa schiedti]|nr:solute carrier family 44 protein member 2 [Pelomyxa schiedti]